MSSLREPSRRAPVDAFAFEGRTVAGRYRIERVLGVGGSGAVFLAEQVALGRRVAVKILPISARGTDVTARRALREAQTLASVEHENIVRVLDFGRVEETGEMFIVLELLEGKTLRELILELEFIPWRWAVQAMGQVLDALALLHARGLVHRDVKPSNCFCMMNGRPLSERPRIKLIDFGIAKHLASPVDERITEVGRAICTPAYAAPEQIVAGRADVRSDIHCAGVTLFELITGKLPAQGHRVASDPAAGPRPSSTNPAAGIPPELDDLVLRALSAAPERRFQSAQAMASELRRILEGENGDGPTERGEGAAGRAGGGLGVADARAQEGDDPGLGRLSAKVESFWVAGVLRSSLAASPLIPQARTREEGWTADLGAVLQAAPPAAIPSDESILTVFEEGARSLLLLGDPGTGKTTQLLLLAQALLDAGSPAVPVVFTLATWVGATRSMQAWMVDELSSHYQVPPPQASEWLSKRKIVPLLDGLDEAPSERRAQCIAAINRLIEMGALPGIVVTSRTREYQSLPERLRLTATVRMHRLSRDAVSAVFRSNHVLTSLPASAQGHLLELAESPLAFALLVQIASEMSRKDDSESGRAEDLRALLDRYVAYMIARSGKKKLRMDRRRFLAGLGRLAEAMQRNHCAILRLDALQPCWLDRPSSLALYALGSRVLTSIVFALGLIFIFGLGPLRDMAFLTTIAFGVRLAMCVVATAGLASGIDAALLLCTSARESSAKPFPRRHAAIMGAGTAIANAIAVGCVEHHWGAAFVGAQAGLATALLLAPHSGIGGLRSDVRPHHTPRLSARPLVRALASSGLLGLAGFVLSSGGSGLVGGGLSAMYGFAAVVLLEGLGGRGEDERGAAPTGLGRTLYSAFLGAVLGGLIWASLWPMARGVFYGLCIALTAVVALATCYGGYPRIQYLVLRALLHLEGQFYCKATFLDAAADRGLIHRVGGGYMFLHPLFVDHLAARSTAERRGGNSRVRSGLLVTP